MSRVEELPTWGRLSVRAWNILHAKFGRFPLAEEVSQLTVMDLLVRRGCGRKTIHEVQDALSGVGLCLKGTEPNQLLADIGRRERDAGPELAALLREFRDRAFEDTGLDWDRRARVLLRRIDGAAAQAAATSGPTP